MSLLHHLIDSLSPTERLQAKEWLAHPLHNGREDVRLLFEQPRRALPGYSDVRMRQVKHQLLKRLEDFLLWKDTTENCREEALLRSLHRRGLTKLLRTRLARQKLSDSAGLDRYWLAHLRSSYAHELAGDSVRGDSDPTNYAESLEAYVLALQLRRAAEALSHQRLLPATERRPIPRLPAILAAAAQPPYREEVGIRLFYLAARLQVEADVPQAVFDELTVSLREHGHRFPPDEARDLLLLAINHGLRRANTGDTPAIRKTFELYRLGLKQETLLPEGRLTRFTFNNILGLALRLEETDWAADFLSDYQVRLPEAGRAEVIALGRARLSFARGEDDRVLFYLQQADFQDFIHHLTARVLQLKIYFRREDSYSLLDSHIGSTLKLLSRRKYAGFHRDNYRNIFRLARRISRLRPEDPRNRDHLRQRIKDTSPCTERDWLLTLL